MIGTLLVTPEQMQASASELSGYVDTLEACFRDMQNTVRGTESYWVGEAGEAHRALYQKQVEKTEEMIRRYREHVKDLNAMAGVYSEAEAQATSAADALPMSTL